MRKPNWLGSSVEKCAGELAGKRVCEQVGRQAGTGRRVHTCACVHAWLVACVSARQQPGACACAFAVCGAAVVKHFDGKHERALMQQVDEGACARARLRVGMQACACGLVRECAWAGR